MDTPSSFCRLKSGSCNGQCRRLVTPLVVYLSLFLSGADGFRVNPSRHSVIGRAGADFVSQPELSGVGRISYWANGSSSSGIQSRHLGHLARLHAEGRIPVVGGNWKSNGTVESVRNLVDLLNTKVAGGNTSLQNVEVVVAPPNIHLGYVRDNLRSPVKVATQNVGVHKGYGAYTGEESGDMIKDFGISWTLTGHSERREGFGMPGESSVLVAEKTKAALDQGLNVIACIGEKLPDRESGKTTEVMNEQLSAFHSVLSAADWNRVVIAYEPVWAIGTGKSATPEMAQQTHKEIRDWISTNVSPDVAKSIRILYGGSVKGSNADELASCPDIDGFLVGGAALKEDFVAIIKAAERTAIQSA
eukprot:GHVQ01020963.1.p1 GENE.GHVQ01020963.1~~GHVQ01020963.1.p1  ORF type:complete len:360 (+),score=48.41 GHVQ01020963.1:172-1251(+)